MSNENLLTKFTNDEFGEIRVITIDEEPMFFGKELIEKLGYKMRESVMKKIPYAVILGNKEVESNMVSYRKCGSEETTTIKKDEFIKMIEEEVKNRHEK